MQQKPATSLDRHFAFHQPDSTPPQPPQFLSSEPPSHSPANTSNPSTPTPPVFTSSSQHHQTSSQPPHLANQSSNSLESGESIDRLGAGAPIQELPSGDTPIQILTNQNASKPNHSHSPHADIHSRPNQSSSNPNPPNGSGVEERALPSEQDSSPLSSIDAPRPPQTPSTPHPPTVPNQMISETNTISSQTPPKPSAPPNHQANINSNPTSPHSQISPNSNPSQPTNNQMTTPTKNTAESAKTANDQLTSSQTSPIDNLLPTPPQNTPIPSKTESPTNLAPQQSTNNQKSKRSFLILILILIPLILAVGVAAYLKLKPSQTPPPTTPQIITGAPTPTPSPSAKWQTYTNNKFGISFKYPLSHSLTDNSSDQLEIIINQDQPDAMTLWTEPASTASANQYLSKDPNTIIIAGEQNWFVYYFPNGIKSVGDYPIYTLRTQVGDYIYTISTSNRNVLDKVQDGIFDSIRFTSNSPQPPTATPSATPAL